jgi:LDH2 family malate/lactate/ureidoglycolate dehydrogenase
MAGHKGYALAMMVDVLSGVLTGSGFLSQVHSPYKTAEKSNCGHFMIAINIEAFQPLAEFNTRMEEYIAELKSVPLAKGHDEVFYPGEIEANNDVEYRRDGLLLPEDTLADLARIARETGLTDRLPVAAG